ncbi:hypothetical protein M0802_007840 [Mischocyttarus mexicanus]|nr:hypothetical protein M0802_007840 [Mischocyttarus mexicanus]
MKSLYTDDKDQMIDVSHTSPATRDWKKGGAVLKIPKHLPLSATKTTNHPNDTMGRTPAPNEARRRHLINKLGKEMHFPRADSSC